jgi:hypothetical protein
MGSPRNNAPPSKFDTGSFSFHASTSAGAAAADLQQARDRLQAEADESPPASPAARSDFEGFGVSPPRRDVELENAEDAVRAAAAKIGAKVAPPSTTVDVDVETK